MYVCDNKNDNLITEIQFITTLLPILISFKIISHLMVHEQFFKKITS